LALTKCLLACFSIVLKFATRFAYVVIAIRGEAFCSATKSAFLLLTSNILNSGSSLFLSWAVLFLGRLLVVGGSAACTWVIIDRNLLGLESGTASSSNFYSAQISSVLIPVLSACFLSWFVSGAVFDLYASALDTLVLCKCEEMAANRNRESRRSSRADSKDHKLALV